MSKFFNPDNAFFRVMGKIIDAFYLSLMWMAFCLPLVTAGASTQALYYTAHKSLKGDRGYVWESFWNSFKDHIKESILISVILEIFFVLVTIDKIMMKDWMQQPVANAAVFGVMYYVFFVLQFVIIVWFVEVSCYRARFNMDWKGSLKNSAKIAVAYLPTSVLTVIVLIAAALGIYIFPISVIFMPAIVALVLDYMYERIYRKLMTDEERELEEAYDRDRKKPSGV
ncbi:MAG: YesL family protein [Lachnospiraceae bacterium]|nr:YesL family protein [Lachnospiraceae bacterium]